MIEISTVDFPQKVVDGLICIVIYFLQNDEISRYKVQKQLRRIWLAACIVKWFKTLYSSDAPDYTTQVFTNLIFANLPSSLLFGRIASRYFCSYDSLHILLYESFV